jgi:hypothetical protein
LSITKKNTKNKITKTQKKDFGFCNYSPFDIETMLPPGFVRLLPTSQESKYVIDFVEEKTGKNTSYNFYFSNCAALSRLNVDILDITDAGNINILTTEKLSKLLKL